MMRNEEKEEEALQEERVEEETLHLKKNKDEQDFDYIKIK